MYRSIIAILALASSEECLAQTGSFSQLQVGGSWLSDPATAKILSTNGNIPLLSAFRTSDNTLSFAQPSAIVALAINDNTSSMQSVSAYGLYGEARRSAGADVTQGGEINILNAGNTADITPEVGGNNDGTYGLVISSGRSDIPYNTQYPSNVSVGLAFLNNGRRFRRAIVVNNDALDPAGPMDAIALSSGQNITTYNPTGGARIGYAVVSAVSAVSGSYTISVPNLDGIFIDVSLNGHANNAFAPSAEIDLGSVSNKWNAGWFRKVNISGTAPSSSSSACASGDIAVSTAYIYVCTATNTWKRSQLVAF